jgi:hypothetical protein
MFDAIVNPQLRLIDMDFKRRAWTCRMFTLHDTLILNSLESHTRAVLAVLTKVHAGPFTTEQGRYQQTSVFYKLRYELQCGCLAVDKICTEAKSVFANNVRPGLSELAALIPCSQYYRYCDHWTRTMQQICFAAAFYVFLEQSMGHENAESSATSSQLLTADRLQELLGGICEIML